SVAVGATLRGSRGVGIGRRHPGPESWHRAGGNLVAGPQPNHAAEGFLTSIVDAPEYLFTSESVTEGHPDKLCDQVSDAILDSIIRTDPDARVACETATTTGLVI